MQLRPLCSALLLAAAALPLHAQIANVPLPPKYWATGWVGMYTTVDNIFDPGTDSGIEPSNWAFGDQAFTFGANLEREVTQGLLFGLEGSYATTEYERRSGSTVVAAGDAKLVTAFVTGRLLSGGMGGLTAYLKGGIGAFGYQLDEMDGTNFDFALTSGAGAEYRFTRRLGVLLEWNQFWAYHEKEGLDEGNTGRHSLIRLGVRAGL